MKKTYKTIFIAGVFMFTTTDIMAGNCDFLLNGKCYDCNTPYSLKVGSKDACVEKCPNRIYFVKDRTCRLGDGKLKALSSSDTSVDIKNCTLKEDEEDKLKKDQVEEYFKGLNGKCYTCSTSEPVLTNDVDCTNKRFCPFNCAERTTRRLDENSLYSVRKCKKEKPLMDRYLMCWSCSEPYPIDLSFGTSLNQKCKDIRYLSGPFSLLK